MFQATTRFILFIVGVALTASTVVLGAVGPVIFSAARTSILVLLIWSLFILLLERRRYPRDNRLVWLTVFSVAFSLSLVTSLFSGARITALLIDGVQLGAAIAFSLLLAYVISNRRRLDALLVGYLLSVIITSMSVLISGSGDGGGGVVERSGGLGGDPNQFAVEAAMTLPIAALFFYTKSSVLWRVFLTVVVVLALAAIMQSLSRTALVATSGMFGLWVLRFRRFDVLRYVLPVAVLVFLGFAFASPEWRERMTTMTSSEGMQGDESIMSRFEVGEFAFRAFASNPILGVGYKQFSFWAVEHRRYLRHADPQAAGGGLLFRGQAIHNAYLSVMAEMGLLGLIPFLALLVLTWGQYSAAWRLARGARGDPEVQTLYLYAIFLQLAFLGMLIAGLFLPTIYWKSLWFLLGLSVIVLDLMARRVAEVQLGAAADKTSSVGDDHSFDVPGFGSQAPLDPLPDLR